MRPPLGIRVLGALRKEPDWRAMPPEALAKFREAENRRRSSRLVRVVSGFPDRGAAIAWRRGTRVYRPKRGAQQDLPLIVHVHGGGFVGTATQSDWINSHLAARLPAVVLSVEHRLVDPATPLSAAVDDAWDVLEQANAGRVAVFGESAGGAIAALVAIRARDHGLRLRAQVLVNPCVDLTETALQYDSMHGESPTLTVSQMEFFRGMAVAEGEDPRSVSPLYTQNLSDLAPALVVVPTLDAIAGHGRAYAERLRKDGTPVMLTEHPGAPHAFLSMPGLVPQARAARQQITRFLRDQLA